MAKSKFDASGQALGYLHQVRCALLLAMRHGDTTDCISLEIIDDVTFSSEADDTAKEVLQYKHSVSKTANLTDKSVDLWKTVRVWSERVKDNELDPEQTIFTLVTTSSAGPSSSLRFLRKENRSVEKARLAIESAGASSTNATVKTAYSALANLKLSERKSLFNNLYLVDNAPDIQDARRLIEHELRFSVEQPESQLTPFADRLEGWWLRHAIQHLYQQTGAVVQIGTVHQYIRDLIKQFTRDNLPDDFIDAVIPNESTLSKDERIFVLELQRLYSSRHVIRGAQEDHYRAFEQRAKWLRETLLRIEEETAYEKRLLREWANKASRVIDGYEAMNDIERVELGKKIYDWVQDSACGPSFLIRPEFVSAYLARGSYHMLVDKRRLVWHPDQIEDCLSAILEAVKSA